MKQLGEGRRGWVSWAGLGAALVALCPVGGCGGAAPPMQAPTQRASQPPSVAVGPAPTEVDVTALEGAPLPPVEVASPFEAFGEGSAQGPRRVTASTVGDCRRARPGVGVGRLGATRQSSPVALAQVTGKAGRRVVAYVADGDDPLVHTVDVEKGRVLAVTRTRGTPEHLMVLADGRVAATLRGDGALEILEPGEAPEAPLTSRCLVGTPTEPVAMALTPDDATLLVTSGWGHALTAYEAAALEPRFQADLPREPRAVVTSEDGKRAFVAHVVNATMSVVDLEGDHRPRAVDLRVKQVTATSGSQSSTKTRLGCQGFALTSAVEATEEGLAPAQPAERPQGVAPPPPRPAQRGPAPSPRPATRPVGRLFAPFVTVDPGEPTRATSGYGSSGSGFNAEISAVAVVDAGAERSLNRALLGVPSGRSSQGARPADCVLPRAAAYAAGSLYVTCLGNDTLVRYDARGVDPARSELHRWSMPSGPTGVALDVAGGRAVVYAHFAHQVAIVPLRDDVPTQTLALPRKAPNAERAAFERGRVLFHRSGDPTISRDGRGCASCHPDGREDALTWATPEGPRQTIMLAGRVKRQASFSWSGANPTIEDHLRHTVQRLEGTGLAAPLVADLVAYVAGMSAPSERSGSEARQALVARGQAVFHAAETACASCHPGGGSDGKVHDIGSQATGDRVNVFVTPSLRHVKNTAPYFHDGRYATLDKLLEAVDSNMGHTAHLSREDRAALAAYLESL